MLKGLTENECGGQNPLMKLTNHFTNNSEHLRTQDNVKNRQQLNNSVADSFVSEYLGIDQKVPNQQHFNHNAPIQRRQQQQPRTFQMERLLSELKQIDTDNKTIRQPQTSSLNNQSNASLTNNVNPANDWSQEYFSLNNMLIKQQPNDCDLKWSTDYLTQTEATIFDEAWGSFRNNNSIMSNYSSLIPMINDKQTDLDTDINMGTITNNNQLNEEMRKTANELLDSMQDSRFSETEFLSFVRNLSQNNQVNSLNDTLEDSIYTEQAASNATAESANLYDADNQNETDLSNEWVKEFQSNFGNDGKGFIDEEKTGSFWNDLQNEWNVAASTDPEHPWLDDFNKVFDTYKNYEFDKENPLESHPNPFEEGQERLKAHDIVNAVLLFEVAVSKEPENALAWQYLGTTQVENEQDAQAIRALRRCLELQPDNLTALSTLATSYTNESMQRLAFYSLIKWLKYHPDYSHLLKNDEQAARLLAASETMNETDTPFYMATLSVVHAGDFIDLQEVFLKAVRESSSLNTNKIDPNLQCCLGVLFHLSGEYDKAADCFKTALQIKPSDHLLWNKLGATFANSNRNEEAIDAYYQALKLCPGFVRARYNLGIGCMNLGAYKEAVEHFLTALVQQSQANLAEDVLSETTQSKRNKIQQMSETIWNTLRLALSYLNRSDLYQHCLNKDLEHLKEEFKI